MARIKAVIFSFSLRVLVGDVIAMHRKCLCAVHRLGAGFLSYLRVIMKRLHSSITVLAEQNSRTTSGLVLGEIYINVLKCNYYD